MTAPAVSIVREVRIADEELTVHYDPADNTWGIDLGDGQVWMTTDRLEEFAQAILQAITEQRADLEASA